MLFRPDPGGAAVRGAVPEALGPELEHQPEQRVIRAAMAPPGIGHLEDRVTKDRIAPLLVDPPGWSHHWRKCGPMLQAELTSRWSMSPACDNCSGRALDAGPYPTNPELTDRACTSW